MALTQAPKPDARTLNVPVAPAKSPVPNPTAQHSASKSASNSVESRQKPPNPASSTATSGVVPAEQAQKVPKSAQIVPLPPEHTEYAPNALETHASRTLPGLHLAPQSAALGDPRDSAMRGPSKSQWMQLARHFSGEQLFVYGLATG